MIKRNNKSIISINSIKDNTETPCRECTYGGIENNFMIFCNQLKHCVVASNRKCKCGKYEKR